MKILSSLPRKKAPTRITVYWWHDSDTMLLVVFRRHMKPAGKINEPILLHMQAGYCPSICCFEIFNYQARFSSPAIAKETVELSFMVGLLGKSKSHYMIFLIFWQYRCTHANPFIPVGTFNDGYLWHLIQS